jgi:hypothetical protein
MNVAIPFVIKVWFNEDVRPQTLTDTTFQVYDVNDTKVLGDLQYDQSEFLVTFTPKPNFPLIHASPYKVTLEPLIQDKAGNNMTDFYKFSFSTELPPQMDKYKTLAEKYAPVIYQATIPQTPQFDFLTTVDFDQDFKGMNNVDNVKVIEKIPSYIYYSVIESKSHYFITYTFYYPFRFENKETDRLGNDTSGATVVVAKYPAEIPVAVEAYFKFKESEEVRAYVTEESGIVGTSGGMKEYYGVNAKYAKDKLFPSNRYEAYLTAKTHNSCVWLYTEKNMFDPYCKLDEAQKTTMKRIKYISGNGTSDELLKTSGLFPDNKDDVKYGMKDVLAEWWTRRHLVGEDKLFLNNFTYQPPDETRPGKGIVMPALFVEPLNTALGINGRPTWSWMYTASGTPSFDYFFYQIPKGTLFLDPVYYFGKRHRIENTFNSSAKTGYSYDYCFNPYLKLDFRFTDNDCK